ncbi:hypothetical protein [Crocosphaera sp.]|nr:hypothetical protein [Crocosphaera sp.]
MNARSQLIVCDKKLTTWDIINPFLTGLAGVGLGILVGFYLGLV